MALELNISETEIADNSIVITDITGDYNVSTNDSGYGTPNPDRSDLKLFLRTFHVDKDGDDAIVNPAATDPDSVSSWVESDIKDGHKKHYIVGIDKSSNVPLDSDVNAFLDAQDLDDLTNDSVVDINGTSYQLYITKKDTFPIPQARIDRINANEKVNTDCEVYSNVRTESQAYYDLLRLEMESAIHNFNVGNYVRAQICIEKANEIGEQLYEES